MSGLVVTAIITPKEEQDADLVEQVLAAHASYVLENEPNTLRYRLHKSLAGKPTFTMIETYKDKASADAHQADPKFKELVGKIGSKIDMQLYVSQAVGGFEDRNQSKI